MFNAVVEAFKVVASNLIPAVVSIGSAIAGLVGIKQLIKRGVQQTEQIIPTVASDKDYIIYLFMQLGFTGKAGYWLYKLNLMPEDVADFSSDAIERINDYAESDDLTDIASVVREELE